jgi:DNA-binding NarL/FixJ family response regulator
MLSDAPNAAQAPPITVVVADPYPPMANAIVRLLDAQPDIATVAQAESLPAAARVLREHRPSVLILDPAVLGGSLRMMSMLRQASPGTHVLLVGMEEEPSWLRALQARDGVSYLAKGSAAPTWLRAVRAGARR